MAGWPRDLWGSPIDSTAPANPQYNFGRIATIPTRREISGHNPEFQGSWLAFPLSTAG